MRKPKYEGAKAEAFLALFENDKTLQDIARYRYVEGLTIEKTAMLVGYCERQVQRLCKKIEQKANQACVIHCAKCKKYSPLENASGWCYLYEIVTCEYNFCEHGIKKSEDSNG